MKFNLLSKGSFQADFPLSNMGAYKVFAVKAVIHQKIREHDTAVIRLRSKTMNWFEALSTGTPVQISYWNELNKDKYAVFYGYVTHVRLTNNEETNAYEREIVCVAASRDLRQTARATYRNKSAPEIVYEIAKKFNFTVVSKQHPLRRPTVTQNGETYWEFLIKLAKRTGYVLRVEGTTIFFMPLKDMVAAYASRSPYLSDFGNLNNIGSYEQQNVLEISSWAGDASDDEDDLTDAAILTAVVPSTGEVFTAEERPGSVTVPRRSSRSQYVKYPSGVVAHTRQDAKLFAKGIADNGMMALDARLLVVGDPYLAPYRTVTLDLKDRPLSGTWIVKEATHTFTRDHGRNKYVTDVVVSTDSIDGIDPRIAGARRGAVARDLGAELSAGFSPDLVGESRLRTVQNGFVMGQTANGYSAGRWVAS